MPFASPQQRKFLFAEKPEIAQKFAADSPKSAISRAIKPENTALSTKNSFDAPKWAKNPWSEMLKRKGIPSLTKTNKGF